MICNIIEEITRNQADLDLYEISIEVFPQSSFKKCLFVEFKLIVSVNSPVFQPLFFGKLKIFPRPMVVWPRLFACLDMDSAKWKTEIE
jgi:hypothetical protein